MKSLLPPSQGRRRTRWLVSFAIALPLALGLVIWVMAGTMPPDAAHSGSGSQANIDPNEVLLRLAEIVVSLVLLFPILYLSTWCHELGHAVMGRSTGYVITAFGMGLGKPLFVLTWAGMRVFQGTQSPLQGLTLVFQPRLVSTRMQVVLFGLGGVLGNALVVPLALLVLVLWPFEWGALFWLLTAGFNLAFALGNLVPIRVKVGHGVIMSDGALVLYTVRAGQFPSAPVNTIALVATLRGLLRDIGDRLLHSYYLLAAASAWRSLGSVARAEELWADAVADAGAARPEVDGLIALTRGGIAVSAERWAEAAEALDRAEALFQSLAHEVGLYLTTLIRAEYLLKNGDAPAAAALLEPLARCALVQQRPVFRADWLVACVEAHAVLPGENGLDRLRAAHEALYRRFPSVERNFAVYRALAVRAAQRGDWHTAEPAFRKALDAAQQMHDGLPTDPDRLHFLECQRTRLIEPASACLRQLGKSDEADRVTSRFRLRSERSPQPSEAEAKERILNCRKRNRRHLLLGLLVGLFDLVMAVGVVVMAREEEVARALPRGADPYVEDLIGIGGLLGLGAFVVLPLGVFWFVAGLIIPSLHNRLGWVLPLMGIATGFLAAMLLAVRLAFAGH